MEEVRLEGLWAPMPNWARGRGKALSEASSGRPQTAALLDRDTCPVRSLDLITLHNMR